MAHMGRSSTWATLRAWCAAGVRDPCTYIRLHVRAVFPCGPIVVGYVEQYRIQRVHVASWNIHRPQNCDIVTPLRPMYIPEGYMEPFWDLHSKAGARSGRLRLLPPLRARHRHVRFDGSLLVSNGSKYLYSTHTGPKVRT